jgi:DNA polymerase (family 10)
MVMVERNREIADLFHALADTLAAENANPHRIRAYRRAAASILSLHEDIAAIAQRGELQAIPGIGRELSAKIEEFLATGTVHAQNTPGTPLPPDIATWTSLPGFSESLVQHLYGRLGIRTLDDLETLVRSHMLRTLPGAAVNEDRLLAAIRALRQHEAG